MAPIEKSHRTALCKGHGTTARQQQSIPQQAARPLRTTKLKGPERKKSYIVWAANRFAITF